MKKLRWVLLVVLLFAAALFFWRWRSPRAVPASKDAPPLASASARKTPTTPAEPALPQPVTSTTTVSKGVQMADFLGAVNHKIIEFYGKVVDQHGAPLAGVGVYASAIYNTGLSSGLDKKQAETDAAGLFSINGMKGRTLGIGLAKDGYQYGGDHGPFQFTEMVKDAERYHPDAENPVVFVMWKLQGAEPMIYFERRDFRLPSDGTPVRIDLATGKKVLVDGDISITLHHPMAQSGQWLQRYPWTARIVAGGLSESAVKLMYLAPENGYVPMLAYGEKGDEHDQQRQIQRNFYLQTSDGRYARVKLDLHTQTNPDRGSFVGLTWWLNPKPGSRNLEFDPTKVITPPR